MAFSQPRSRIIIVPGYKDPNSNLCVRVCVFGEGGGRVV